MSDAAIKAALEEVQELRLALSAIALECQRCRGEQSYRDTTRFAWKTAMRALGRRGIERDQAAVERAAGGEG